jgi:hypothetical protein
MIKMRPQDNNGGSTWIGFLKRRDLNSSTFCHVATTTAKEPYWKGRLSTVDLHIKIAHLAKR